MINFQELSETKKGNAGENIVIKRLEAAGWTVYTPYRHNKSHPIDIIAMIDGKIALIDVKCKPSRIRYPDTGLDLNDWEKYVEMAKTQHVCIAFVDEYKKMVYWRSVKKLLSGIWHVEKRIIYFDLTNFIGHTYELTDAELTEITRWNNRAPEYDIAYTLAKIDEVQQVVNKILEK